MVVIEPVSSTSSASEPPKPNRVDGFPAKDTSAEDADYSSDGFETASETEVNDHDDGDDDGAEAEANDDDKDKESEQEETKEQSVGPSNGESLDDEQLQQKALLQANDAKSEGNKLFGNEQYEEALLQYEIALQVTPEAPLSAEIRSICHANRAACFSKLGKFEDTIKECTKALELNPSYVKALVRRAEAHEKLEHYAEALADMTKTLQLDPSHQQARRAVVRLKPLADEQREKMKEEMIGKLKDMGNSVLGRFGMSVDNFKAVKDPNTGSYSISFQR